jgi:LmbE family N-acetylglucosaminyl deacetylase
VNLDALVVVAHDDDALLWMGGTIHHLSRWNWHIISMCNQGDTTRRCWFKKTCDKLGARADALDFLDYQDSNTRGGNSTEDMKRELLRIVGDKLYDYVFTHDPTGEYGAHANHDEVRKAVTNLVSEGHLVENGSRLAHFCYSPIYEMARLATVASTDASYYFQLTYSDLAFKVELIQSHAPDIVSNLERGLGAPCPNPEAFAGDRLNLPDQFIRNTNKQV